MSTAVMSQSAMYEFGDIIKVGFRRFFSSYLKGLGLRVTSAVYLLAIAPFVVLPVALSRSGTHEKKDLFPYLPK